MGNIPIEICPTCGSPVTHTGDCPKCDYGEETRG